MSEKVCRFWQCALAFVFFFNNRAELHPSLRPSVHPYFTSSISHHRLTAYFNSALLNLCRHIGSWKNKHCVCACVCVYVCMCASIQHVFLLYPEGLIAALLGRGAAVFTTCYETSLLCSSDSVTQSERKTMLLHISTSRFGIFSTTFLLKWDVREQKEVMGREWQAIVVLFIRVWQAPDLSLY